MLRLNRMQQVNAHFPFQGRDTDSGAQPVMTLLKYFVHNITNNYCN